MSEFTESFNFKAASKENVEDFIEELDIFGDVFDEENGWITFLPAEEFNSCVEKIGRNYPGVVLYYMYTDDHGWMMNLFSNKELISKYFCDWDNGLRIDNTMLNLIEFVKILGVEEHKKDLEELFALSTLDEIFDDEQAERFAEIMQIE